MKSISNIDFELIEDFLLKKLKPEDEKNFKKRLQTDSEFLKEYKFRVDLQKLWNEAEIYQDVKSYIKQFNQKRRRKKRLLYSMLAAASVIFLFGASVLFFPKINYKKLIISLINSEKDTITNLKRPLQINKLIKRGNLYKIDSVYHSNNTLFILRRADFPKNGEVRIIRIEDNKQIFKMNLLPDMDSIFIPLHGIKHGEYKCVLIGTTFTKNFIIEAEHKLKD